MAYTNFTNCTKEQYESIIYSEEDTNRIRIWFNNVELQDADEYCESLSGTNRILPNDGNKVFTLDNFIAKEYQLILRDLPASTIIADQVKISIGTLVDETNSIYEDVPIGIFNIQDTPTRDNGKITIKLRDNRVKFDFNYNAQPLIESLGGTATKKQILEDICNQAGVINNVLVFDGQDDEVGIYDNTITATTYVSYIFEQAGLMPTINRNGELDKIDFNNLKVWRIPLSIVENYELGTPFEVQRVVYESGVVKYESSSEESLQTLYLDASNPYITNEEQIENIYNMLNCFSIDSVKTGKILGNPAIDPFDMIIIYDDEINDNPTTNSTGSTISLENTPNAPMKIVLKPQTLSQSSSPTPTSPQEVHTITGRNTIDVWGKNMFDESQLLQATGWKKENSIYFGTIDDYYTKFRYGFTGLHFKTNTQYTISLKGYTTGGTPRIKIVYTDNSSETLNISATSMTSYTKTTNANKNVSSIQADFGTGSANILYLSQFMIEEGSTATTYEPYIGNSYEVNLGKNLINPYSTNIGTSNGITTTYNDDQSLSFSGTTTGTWAYLTNQYSTGKIDLNIPSGNYTFSIDKASSVYTTIIRLFYDSSNYQDITINKNTTSRTINVTNNTIAYQIYIGGLTSGTELNETLHFQLERGLTATEMVKYFEPIELCKIGNYEDGFIRTTGKNLFDISQYPLSTQVAYDSTGARSYWAGYVGILNYFPVKGNTTYTFSNDLNKSISYGLVYYDENKNIISVLTSATTFTTPSNCKYIRLAIHNETSPTWVQLELGSTATEYEPYSNNEWYIKKAIGKVVLDGSESWITWNDVSTGNTRLFGTNNYDGIKKIGYIGICNYFINSTTTLWNADTQGMQINATGSHTIRFRINKTLANDLTTFKTWLNANKPIVYYVLATPTYTKIENEELIEQLNKVKNSQSQDGQTNISQVNNDLPFILNVESFNESYILRTLANNTYTYNGVNRNQFDTQIGLEQRTENVSINSEAILKKWAKTNIDNLQGQITLSAGDINDLEGRVNQTELDISSQSAKIEVLSTNIDEKTGNVLGVKTTSYELGSNGFIIDDGTGYKSIDNTTGKYFYDNNSMVGKYTKDGSVQKNLALFGKYYYGVDENVNVKTFSKEKAMFIAQVYTGQDMQGNDETGFGHFYNGD